MIRTRKSTRIIFSVIALLVAAIIAFPVIWMIPAAFKSKAELFSIPNTFLPREFTLQNFIKVFQVNVNGSTYLKAMGATTVVAVVSTFFSLLINMFAGYVFARFEFRSGINSTLFFAVIFHDQPRSFPGFITHDTRLGTGIYQKSRRPRSFYRETFG